MNEFPITQQDFHRYLSRQRSNLVVGDQQSSRDNTLVRTIAFVEEAHVFVFIGTWRYRNTSPLLKDEPLPNWALEFRLVEEACTEPITAALALSILDLITEHV